MTQSSTDSSLVERLRHGVPLTEVDGREVADTDAANATMELAANVILSLTAQRDDFREKAARMGEALKPFSEAAGGVFTRNFNASDVLFRKPATASHAESVITAGHLFAARSVLQSEKDREGGE